MKDTSNRTTLIAGLFVLGGLVLLGTLIFQFGTLRHRLREPYVLYANFLDAQNLIKGAPVKRAGATIGQVVSSPKLVDGLKGVQVTLEVYPEFRIPTGSPLKISSVGLMGDSVIDVGQPPPELLTGEFFKPGTTINGTGSPDFSATATKLTDEIMVVMRDLRNGLRDLNVTVGKLNDGVLSEENLNNFSNALREVRESVHKIDDDVLSDGNVNAVKEALTSMKDAMAKLDNASSRADGLMAKAESAIGKADKAMDNLGPALKGAEGATVNLKQAATSLEGLLKDARSGRGLMSALLNDEGLRGDFAALIGNLKTRGFLFYKDKEAKAAPPERPRAKPFGTR